MRRGRAAVAAAVATLALTVSLTAGSAAPGTTPSVQSLLTRATAMVRAKKGFAKAVLLEADGTGKGEMKNAAGVTKWRFVYNNQTTPKFKYRAAFVFYRNGRLGNFKAVKEPFLQDRNVRPIKEPLYIFGFSSGTYVSVGTRTGRVRRLS